MKKIIIVFTMVVICNSTFSQVILNAPSNFKGTGISPTLIKFTWNDVSQNEEGFKLQRKILGIWFTVATLPPTSTYNAGRIHSENITVSAEESEVYRMFSYKGLFKRSDYANQTVTMPTINLDPDRYSLGTSMQTIKIGTNTTIKCKVINTGNYPSYSTSKLRYYLTWDYVLTDDDILLGELEIGSAIAPGASSPMLYKTVTIPLNAPIGNCGILIQSIAEGPGYYQLQGTETIPGCYISSTTSSAKSLELGIETLAESDEFIVFPNPNEGKFSIKNISENVNLINIYDISGKMVHSTQVNKQLYINVELPELANGFYIIEFKGNGIYKNKEFILKK